MGPPCLLPRLTAGSVSALLRSQARTRFVGGFVDTARVGDTWFERDLPVLKAAVEVFERDGDPMEAGDIAAALKLGPDIVQRALRALSAEPFFAKGMESGNGEILCVGKPTSQALRATGQWPSPVSLLDRLIGALEAAGEDAERVPEERSKLKQLALGLRSAGRD
jgi:hypothetical protein